MYLKYTWSILKVYIKNTDLIPQKVLQMYFFYQNNIDLKYTCSVIQQLEVYSKYSWSILEVYFKYTWVYFKYALDVYFQYVL